MSIVLMEVGRRRGPLIAQNHADILEQMRFDNGFSQDWVVGSFRFSSAQGDVSPLATRLLDRSAARDRREQ